MQGSAYSMDFKKFTLPIGNFVASRSTGIPNMKLTEGASLGSVTRKK
jgi:hypothetical protein